MHFSVMKRNEVIQFRVTAQEKEELKQRAHPYDVSRLIREALGLPVGLKATVAPEAIEGAVGAVLTPEANVRKATEQDIAELVTKLKGQGMTTPVATREARRRLGL